MNAVVLRNHRAAIPKIVEEVGTSIFSAHFIVNENLTMRRIAEKFVQKLLTLEQKQIRVEVSQVVA